MRRIDEAAFTREVLQAPGAVVVKFTSTHCQPCRVLGEALEAIGPSFPGVAFVEVNIEESPDLADAQAVGVVPTLVAFVGGSETDRSVPQARFARHESSSPRRSVRVGLLRAARRRSLLRGLCEGTRSRPALEAWLRAATA